MRSAIVTGAAQGIGRAIAERLAADGFTVTVADLRFPDLVPADLTLELDVTDPAAVDAAVAAHVDSFGGLDVMVANAGIAVTAPLLETTPEQLQRVMDVNFTGVFHCYKSAARQMIAQGRGGRLIGAASVAAHRGGKWQGAYSASKFAVRGLSQSVAQELAEHIRGGRRVARQRTGRHGRRDPAGPVGDSRRRGRRRVVPGVRRLGLRHRPVDRGRRRHVVLLINPKGK